MVGVLRFLKKLDWLIILATMTLVVLGLVSFYGIGPKSGFFIKRQVIFAVSGILIMIWMSSFDYRIFKNFASASLILYIIGIVLLAMALASQEIRGVSSWIVFKNLTFGPSEFAKISTLILLAKYFSQRHVEIYRLHHILVSGVYVSIPTALTLAQPDLGSAMVFISLWLAILLFSGIKRRHLLAILMAGLAISSLAWFFALKPYQQERIKSFANPYLDPRGSGYNALQSKIAIGSGKLWGTFWKNTPGLNANVDTRQTPQVLVPEPYNDFAFAVFAKKFGFAGILVLFASLVVLTLRIVSVAVQASNNFAKLFSLGLLAIIFTHISINTGMNLGLLPITGISFPFLSYGGSGLITLMIGLGIVQSIKVRSGV